jgi:hypothetical protein
MHFNPWTYKGKIFTDLDIGDNIGFVYILTNILTNKKYIGLKNFYTSAKSRHNPTKQRIISNWKDYYGSSKSVDKDIQEYGKDRFIREIHSLHKTKRSMTYVESRLLLEVDALTATDEFGNRLYYNENIGGILFSPT